MVPIETTTEATTTATDPGTVPASPTDVVRAFLISPDAELVCDELITEKFLRASYGDRAGCLSARKPATLATSVQLSGGAGGVVKAMVNGGLYDGDELTFTLVGTGVIDSVKSDAPVGAQHPRCCVLVGSRPEAASPPASLPRGS